MKKAIAFLAFLMTAAICHADTTIVDGITWTYTVVGDVVSVGGGTSSSTAVPKATIGAITIPSMLGDKPVESIGPYAFYGCSGLTSVEIPNSVTNVGKYAFYNCSGLEAVYIADIEKWFEIMFSFEYANPLYYAHNLYVNGLLVEDLTIPDGVTSVGGYAFCGCSGLTSVEISSSVTNIGNYAFEGCSRLASVTMSGGVSQIGSRAFMGCVCLTSVTIPNTVTSIGDAAFYRCSGLEAVYITDVAKWCEISFYNLEANPLYYAHNLYVNGSLVEDLTIPDGVTSVGRCALGGCSGLSSVEIPNSVTNVGNSAFYGCSGLADVTIPDGVISVGQNAFYGCSGLTGVSIPNSVTNIGDYAFYGCSGLTGVTIPNSVTSLAPYAFYGCRGLTSVAIPNSVRSIARYAFCGCRGLTSVAIPNSVRSIEQYAFSACSGLTSVEVSDNLISLGSCAFSGCNGLVSATMPASIVSIANDAFRGCSGLTNITVNANNAQYSSENGLLLSKDGKNLIIGVNGDVTIPNSVTNIGDSAFYGCSDLVSVAIPNSVTTIERTAFSGCSGITSVTIPAILCSASSLRTYFSSYQAITNLVINDGVTSIGAFSGCTALVNVSIPNSVTNIVNYSFSQCSEIKSVTVPQIVCLSWMSNTFPQSYGSITTVNIAEGVTQIGERSFGECHELNRVTIPASVKSIANGAFKGCTAVECFQVHDDNLYYKSDSNMLLSKSGQTLVCGVNGDVSIPVSVTSIEESAFYGYSGLRSVTIPASVMRIGKDAFGDCGGLESVYITDLAKWCGISFGNLYANPLYSAHKLYVNGSLVEDMTIPDGVTSIGGYAFCGCSGLTSVAIPDSVRGIENYAFYGCSGLTRVTIPNSVGLLGNAAFSGCGGITDVTVPQGVCSIGLSTIFPSASRGITNVVVAAGVTKLASSSFSNCSSLKSVTIPASVTRIEDNVFSDCASLKDVYFEGDMPDIGEGIYLGTPRSLVTHVPEGSIGWAGGISSELPEDWNGRGIVHGSSAGGGGGSGSSGESGHSGSNVSVSLTVTNVVVHYFLNSVVPEIAVPVSGDTGFVTVVTEIKGGAVAVPESWATNYPGFAGKFGGDFSAALTKPTGKLDSQGNALLVWQDYVAGTDPTSVDDVFTATIAMVDGEPVVGYTPELPEAEKAKRKYTIYGKARLQDDDWTVVDGDAANYNFFKVAVEMK